MDAWRMFICLLSFPLFTRSLFFLKRKLYSCLIAETMCVYKAESFSQRWKWQPKTILMENCSSYMINFSQYESSIEGNKHVNLNFPGIDFNCTSFYMLVS